MRIKRHFSIEYISRTECGLIPVAMKISIMVPAAPLPFNDVDFVEKAGQCLLQDLGELECAVQLPRFTWWYLHHSLVRDRSAHFSGGGDGGNCECKVGYLLFKVKKN